LRGGGDARKISRLSIILKSDHLPREISIVSFKKILLAGCLSVFCACFVAGCASEQGGEATDGGAAETGDTNSTSAE